MIQAGWNQTIGNLAILGRLAGLSKNVANISETVEAANKPEPQPWRSAEININPDPTPEDLSRLYARAKSYGVRKKGDEFWVEGTEPMLRDMQGRLQTQYGLDPKNASGLMEQVRRGQFGGRGQPTFSEAMQARLQAMRAAEAENVRPTNEMPNGGPNNG